VLISSHTVYAPFFDSKTLAKITPQEIERYVVVKRKTLAIKTVRNHLNTMHSVFELGLRRKWCQSNTEITLHELRHTFGTRMAAGRCRGRRGR
jgi:integrase